MVADDSSVAARLIEIEAKLALSEDLLDELNRTVYRQQQVIDRLQHELRMLQEIVESGDSSGMAAGPRDEIPPHY